MLRFPAVVAVAAAGVYSYKRSRKDSPYSAEFRRQASHGRYDCCVFCAVVDDGAGSRLAAAVGGPCASFVQGHVLLSPSAVAHDSFEVFASSVTASAGTDGIFRGLHRHYFNSMLSVLLPILMESNCAAAASGAPAGTGAAASVAAEQLHKQQQQQEQQSAALSISGAFEALPLSSTMRHIATTAVKNGPTPNVLSAFVHLVASTLFPFRPSRLF